MDTPARNSPAQSSISKSLSILAVPASFKASSPELPLTQALVASTFDPILSIESRLNVDQRMQVELYTELACLTLLPPAPALSTQAVVELRDPQDPVALDCLETLGDARFELVGKIEKALGILLHDNPNVCWLSGNPALAFKVAFASGREFEPHRKGDILFALRRLTLQGLARPGDPPSGRISALMPCKVLKGLICANWYTFKPCHVRPHKAQYAFFNFSDKFRMARHLVDKYPDAPTIRHTLQAIGTNRTFQVVNHRLNVDKAPLDVYKKESGDALEMYFEALSRDQPQAAAEWVPALFGPLAKSLMEGPACASIVVKPFKPRTSHKVKASKIATKHKPWKGYNAREKKLRHTFNNENNPGKDKGKAKLDPFLTGEGDGPHRKRRKLEASDMPPLILEPLQITPGPQFKFCYPLTSSSNSSRPPPNSMLSTLYSPICYTRDLPPAVSINHSLSHTSYVPHFELGAHSSPARSSYTADTQISAVSSSSWDEHPYGLAPDVSLLGRVLPGIRSSSGICEGVEAGLSSDFEDHARSSRRPPSPAASTSSTHKHPHSLYSRLGPDNNS
ncbi:hypothetical protein C8R43DRAFT_959252 [Mycena crocata]|nr:hypothetical protein C8R43DRAFT_959252 [Mycena crocata]